MKKILVELLSLVIMATNAIGTVQAQNGFSYQVVVRNADGTLVGDANVGMKFTLFDDTVKCYQESQTVTTNGFGVASMVIGGNGSKVLAGEFAKVPWSSMNIMMEVEADIKGDGSYVSYGKTQVNPAPYAMYAADAPAVTEIVGGPNSTEEQELFSVKDKDGNLVFAVYPSGVRVFVDEKTAGKAMRSGFAVSGRHSATKDGVEPDYIVVNADGTTVFVDDGDSKAMRSSFAVSKRHSATKDADSVVCSDMFIVNADGTRVFVDADESKAMRSSFAVSNRHSATKDVADNGLLTVDANGTTVYVDADDSKAMRSGFAVSGRHAATKDGEDDNIFVVGSQGTRAFINDSDSLSPKRSFAISGRNAGNAGSPVFSYLQISDTSTWLGVKGSNENPSFSIVDKISRDTMSFIADRRFNINVPTFVEGSIDYRTSVVDTLPTIHYYVPCKYDEGYYYGGDNISLNDLLLGYNSNDNWQIKDWNGLPELTSDKDTLFFSLEQDKGIRCRFYLTNQSTGGEKELVLYDANGNDAVSVNVVFHYYPVDDWDEYSGQLACKRNSDGEFKGTLKLNLKNTSWERGLDLFEYDTFTLGVDKRDSTEFSLEGDNIVINYKLDDNCYYGMWNLPLYATIGEDTKVIDIGINYGTIDTLPDFNYNLLCQKNNEGGYEAIEDENAELPLGYWWFFESGGRDEQKDGLEIFIVGDDDYYLSISNTIGAEEKLDTTTLVGQPNDGGRYVFMNLNLRSIPCDYLYYVCCNPDETNTTYSCKFNIKDLQSVTGSVIDGYEPYAHGQGLAYDELTKDFTYTIQNFSGVDDLGKSETSTIKLSKGNDTIIFVVDAYTVVGTQTAYYDLKCNQRDHNTGWKYKGEDSEIENLWLGETINGAPGIEGITVFKDGKFKYEIRNGYWSVVDISDTIASVDGLKERTVYGWYEEGGKRYAHNVVVRSLAVDFETQIFCSKNGDGTYSGEFPIDLECVNQLLNGRTNYREDNPTWALESVDKGFSLTENKVTFKSDSIVAGGYFKLVRTNDNAKFGIYATIVYDSLPDVELTVLCMVSDPMAVEKEYSGDLSFNVTHLTHGLWNGDDCSIVTYAVQSGDTARYILQNYIRTHSPEVSIGLGSYGSMSVSCTMGASDTEPYNVIVYNKDLRQFFKLKIAFKWTNAPRADEVSAWYIDKQNAYSESESEYEIFVNDSEEGLTYMCTYKEYHVQEEGEDYCYVLSTGNGNEMVGKMQIATGQTQQQPMQWKYDENGKWEDYEYDDVYPSWNEFLEGNEHNLDQQGRYVATLKFANEDRILHIHTTEDYNHHGLYLDHDEEEAVGMQFSDTMYIFTKQPEYDSDFRNDEDFQKCKAAFAGE